MVPTLGASCVASLLGSGHAGPSRTTPSLPPNSTSSRDTKGEPGESFAFDRKTWLNIKFERQNLRRCVSVLTRKWPVADRPCPSSARELPHLLGRHHDVPGLAPPESPNSGGEVMVRPQ